MQFSEVESFVNSISFDLFQAERSLMLAERSRSQQQLLTQQQLLSQQQLLTQQHFS